jgi:hypothetical protein
MVVRFRLLTNAIEQKKFILLLWKPKIDSHFHKIRPLSPAYIFILYFFEIRFNILFLRPTSRSSTLFSFKIFV